MDHRGLAFLDGLVDGVTRLSRRAREIAHATAKLHHLVEARRLNVRANVTVVVKVALIGNLRAPRPVVHDESNRRNVVHDRGIHLAHGHAETAVSHERNDRALRGSCLRAETRGVREADVAAVERRDQRRGRVVRQLIGCLQARCAGVDREQRVARSDLAQLGKNRIGVQRLGVPIARLRPRLPKLLAVLHELLIAGPPGNPVWRNRLDRVAQGLRHRARVAGDADGDREVAPNGHRVDVHLHDLRRRRQVIVLVTGGIEPEARSEREHDIGFAHEPGGDRVPARADGPGIHRMVDRREVAMGRRHRNGQLQLFRELEERRRRPAPLDSGARVNDRGARRHQHGLHLLKRRAIHRAAGHLRSGTRGRDLDLDVLVEEIARYLHHNRTTPTGVGNPERLHDELGYAVRSRHRHDALCDREEQRLLVDLLERVAAQVLR